MQKKPRYFILLLLLTLILVIMLTFLLSYSWSPREEEAPKRSRPVNTFVHGHEQKGYLVVLSHRIEL